jgi:acyl-CoA reductase-like NAD-dependent aldehyde dehydrogenase
MTTGIGTLGQGAILKEPAGVVAAITPYNFPILLAVWKLGPALAVGNTAVLKPSPFTPLSALTLAEIAEESELPPGVLNVVIGGIEVGRVLTTDRGVDLVTFTGSDTVGRQVMAQAATTLKKVVLELGGKSANIVFEDADLDDPMFVPSALGGFITHCGQACAATTRIIVHRSIHDEVAERLKAALPYVKLGDPRDPDVAMGALIRAEAESLQIRQRHIPAEEIVERCLLRLANEGARILEEGIALRASDCDTMYLNGYGFPGWRGGPMWQVDNVIGMKAAAEKIKAYEARYGARWKIAPLIERLAKEGGTFAKK